MAPQPECVKALQSRAVSAASSRSANAMSLREYELKTLALDAPLLSTLGTIIHGREPLLDLVHQRMPGRRSGGCQESEPYGDVEPGQTRFGNGVYVGQQRRSSQ
jgi:hypothetical protein